MKELEQNFRYEMEILYQTYKIKLWNDHPFPLQLKTFMSQKSIQAFHFY